ADMHHPQRLRQALSLLKEYHKTPYRKSLAMPSAYETVRKLITIALVLNPAICEKENISRLWQIIATIETSVQNKPCGLCHNDLCATNFIKSNSRLHLIDWEYGGYGEILFDLASLCVEQELTPEEMDFVLNTYFEKPLPRLKQDLQLLCALYSLRNAFWAYIQAKISSKDFNFSHLAAHQMQTFWRRLSHDP
ncbi:MAG: phosphotransferase, partial [Parachlamydiales bacterium]